MSTSYRHKHVVVTGASGALGGAVVALLEELGATCHAPKVDLTDEDKVAGFYSSLPGLWASIHVAGGFAAGSLKDTRLAELRAMFDKNVVTAFLCSREAVMLMRRHGSGRIVNVAARPALVPTGGMVAYTTSKAAVASLTQCLAAELVAENILVNAVVPSLMDTPANRAAMPGADHAHWPKTSEVAQTIAFLASPENILTSGALVPVYGRS